MGTDHECLAAVSSERRQVLAADDATAQGAANVRAAPCLADGIVKAASASSSALGIWGAAAASTRPGEPSALTPADVLGQLIEEARREPLLVSFLEDFDGDELALASADGVH